MSTETMYYCDLCEMNDDKKVIAIACYTADDNIEYDICKIHLQLVEKVKEISQSIKKYPICSVQK